MAMIYQLRDLIPSVVCSAKLDDGRYVRAMHMQFFEGLWGRVGSAWEVLTGRAVAVKWPESGEFEDAMKIADRY